MLAIAIKLMESAVSVLDLMAKLTIDTRDDQAVDLVRDWVAYLKAWNTGPTEAQIDALSAKLKARLPTTP